MTSRLMRMPRPWGCRAGLALAAGLLLSAAGCGGPSPCVVSGTVLVDDRPADGVYVVFRAIGRPSPHDSGSARTAEDGSFSAVVDEPGESAVTLFWPKVTTRDGDVFEGADRFGGRYRDPQSPASKATVREGETVIPPIKLTRLPTGKARTAFRR